MFIYHVSTVSVVPSDIDDIQHRFAWLCEYSDDVKA